MINSIREHCILQEGDFWEVVSEMNLKVVHLNEIILIYQKHGKFYGVKVKLNSFSFKLYFEWHPPSLRFPPAPKKK